jgi:predicted  nucleic acid-binding Zn-ribbon protein
MIKFFAITMLALASVGCASKGDLNALQNEVDTIKVNVASLKDEVETVKSNQEALKGNLADLNGKIDRLFVKQSRK